MWTLYLVLEPFVRYWPKILVSRTQVYSRRFYDPIVGRDALFGAGLGAAWAVLFRISDIAGAKDVPANLDFL